MSMNENTAEQVLRRWSHPRKIKTKKILISIPEKQIRILQAENDTIANKLRKLTNFYEEFRKKGFDDSDLFSLLSILTAKKED